MSTASVALRDAFGATLLELAETHPELVVLDADVASSTRTSAFGKKYPDRFFNVGVAEANMADIAAGLATCGFRPVVSTFALFLTLKCADQIRNIIAYNKLPVVLAGNYAGLSDSFDGASHQAILDVSLMRAMPNMMVIVPGDSAELKQALAHALRHDGPTYIRICRNPTPVLFEDAEPFIPGRIRKLRSGDALTLVVSGVPVAMAIQAADNLKQSGIDVDLLQLSTIKPIDTAALVESAQKTRRVLTVEEHTVCGGIGSTVAEQLAQHCPVRVEMLGIEDRFAESGEYWALMDKYGISSAHIEARARQMIQGASR